MLLSFYLYFMEHESFDDVKDNVLAHIQQMFEEIEEELAISHQEKYTLLEDAFEQATDVDELRVAFEQWYSEHADDLELDLEADDLWEQALTGEDMYSDEEDEDDYDFNDGEDEETEEDEDEEEEEDEI